MSDPGATHLGREPRVVRADRAFAWYAEAMRLFRRHPLGFVGLSAAVIIVQFVVDQVPVIGRPASNLLVPLAGCSLLYASLAVDRGDRPRLAHLIAPFAAPAATIVTVLLASAAVFGAEWLVNWHLTGTNLLAPDEPESIGMLAAVAVYVSGVVVSLPLTLVPLLALFEQVPMRDAFEQSLAAFFRNIPAFALYGALSIALLGLAFITLGFALLIALPLWAASSYVAWKNLFGID